jgi:hypothetical protein
VREAANRSTSQNNLVQIHLATREYQKVLGTYPPSLSALASFCQKNPALCQFDSRLLSKPVQGYRYSIIGPGVVEGEPEYAGITGSETLTIDPSGRINSTETPGSEEARRQMFNSILAKGGQSVMNAINLDWRTLFLHGTMESPQTAASFTNYLDTNGDGKLFAAEIFAHDNNPESPLGDFLVFVKQAMKLTDEEMPLLPAVQEGKETVKVYGWVRDLTAAQVTDGRSAAYLSSLLSAAETAERDGDTQGESRYLKTYLAEIDSLIGKSLTRGQADVLKRLVSTL